MGAAVEGAMTPFHQLLAVGEDDPASKCLALMISSNIRHLPVLKADGRLADADACLPATQVVGLLLRLYIQTR